MAIVLIQEIGGPLRPCSKQYTAESYGVDWADIDLSQLPYPPNCYTLVGGEAVEMPVAVAAHQKRLADEAAQANKLAGVEFEGVMCSATSVDMYGLASIKDWIAGGGQTKFKFENGNELVISPANMTAFMAVWVPFRQSFFPSE